MIIYNITTQVSWSVHDEWRHWLTDEYLPGILATGLFPNYQLVKLLELGDEDGPTYALQLHTDDMNTFGKFRELHMQTFEKKEKERWRNDVYSFASVMEVIN